MRRLICGLDFARREFDFSVVEFKTEALIRRADVLGDYRSDSYAFACDMDRDAVAVCAGFNVYVGDPSNCRHLLGCDHWGNHEASFVDIQRSL
ncbi:hypothetical protein PROAA_1090014 [Candidatus Propionivibrio aalborgensis]|uniref:Uncharacterized protein n=1 Tax=Candidatus Propionivibrio aalborgensis TaxID=1860101 RepID=A0A1A8XET3_9RHOO|nr:hypothetical protein PROAA_1090014 [Candidatus Propionivibrio aalborgensis]